MHDKYIKKFYEEVCDSYKEEYKIVLEKTISLNEKWIEYDQVKWELDGNMPTLVQYLKENNAISFEEKLLKIYEFICLNYIYDDNVLYFFKKDTSNPENIKYIAIDWYGRIVGEKWINNRKKHNRRICYEFSRYYAKAINMILKDNQNMEAIILGLKDNTHYLTALTGEDYSLVLDLDDFNHIKDLTRLKLGLTLEGIKILRDKNEKFQKALNKFNENRPSELYEIIEAKEIKERDNNMIKYILRIVEIIKEKKLDSQGFCEYLRSLIADEKIKIDKIWKKVQSKSERRYSRCLIFNINQKTYLLDSIDQTLTTINSINNLDKDTFVYNPEENEYTYYGS